MTVDISEIARNFVICEECGRKHDRRQACRKASELVIEFIADQFDDGTRSDEYWAWLADEIRSHFFDASGTPTRRAETTGSVGEADGGPTAESGDAQPFVYRSIPEIAALYKALEWLAAHKNAQVYWYGHIWGDDDREPEEWRVDVEHGGVNDSEWTTIGRGETPLAAIRAAIEHDKALTLCRKEEEL